MDRLKVAFDEGVETIGYKLLPIIEKLLGFVLDKVIPGFNNFIKLFDPLKKVVEDNKETFAAFGAFIVDYIVPVITQKLGAAISFVATVANAVLPIIGGVIKMISSMVSVAIDGINALIRAYNAIPFCLTFQLFLSLQLLLLRFQHQR
jgi:phage-related protein